VLGSIEQAAFVVYLVVGCEEGNVVWECEVMEKRFLN